MTSPVCRHVATCVATHKARNYAKCLACRHVASVAAGSKDPIEDSWCCGGPSVQCVLSMGSFGKDGYNWRHGDITCIRREIGGAAVATPVAMSPVSARFTCNGFGGRGAVAVVSARQCSSSPIPGIRAAKCEGRFSRFVVAADGCNPHRSTYPALPHRADSKRVGCATRRHAARLHGFSLVSSGRVSSAAKTPRKQGRFEVRA